MKKKTRFFIISSLLIAGICSLFVFFFRPQTIQHIEKNDISVENLGETHQINFLFKVEEELTPEEILDQIIKDGTLVSQIIIGVLLFLIPMIIMVVLLIRRKDKKGLKWLYTQKLLSYCIAFFSLFSLIFFPHNIVLLILIFVAFGILTILTFLDTILHRSKNFVLMVFETIAWVQAIYSILIHGKPDASTYVVLWSHNCILFVWTIIQMNVIKPKETGTYLPFTVLSIWEMWVRYLYLCVMFSVAFILTYNKTGYLILALIFICILYILIQYLKGFFWLIRPMRKYWKTLDIVQFEKDILKIQSRPNLHPDTILYYNILFMQCVLVHSKEKFFEYYKECSSPQTKGLQPLYRGLILRYGMSKEEFDNSFEILKKEFYNKKTVLKRINKFYQFWQPYYGMNSNYINEKLYRTDRKKNQYQNAISLFVLIYYYKNNGQLDKAAELKTEFVKKYSVFEECTRDLETV